jgi:hypothetical protein
MPRMNKQEWPRWRIRAAADLSPRLARTRLVLIVAIVAVAVALLGGGLSQPIAAAGPVFPLRLSSNSRYLVDQAGMPFFWNGDSPWSLISHGTRADIDLYLNDRQTKGVNVILLDLIENESSTTLPRNIFGDVVFTGRPFVTPNEAYFAHADYLVQAAGQRGIGVQLVPLYLGFNCDPANWCDEVQAATTAEMQAWGTYVGTRYGAFDNVVAYVVGADMDPRNVGGLASNVDAFATALAQADTRHLITAHNVRGQMATTPWPNDPPWLTLNDIYATHEDTAPQAQKAYNASPVRPFFDVEGWYENEHFMTTQQLRAQAYWTVLSGGMGYNFGNCPLWGLGKAPTLPFCMPGTNPDWHTQLDSPGALSMMHVNEFFTARAWQDLVPDFGHQTLTAGFGTLGSGDYATAARTGDGSMVVAYVPTNRTLTMNMARLGGAATARWYDPSNGTYRAIGGSAFVNSGTQQFATPGNNSAGAADWVLLLEASPQPPAPVPTDTPVPTPVPTQTSAVAPCRAWVSKNGGPGEWHIQPASFCGL